MRIKRDDGGRLFNQSRGVLFGINDRGLVLCNNSMELRFGTVCHLAFGLVFGSRTSAEEDELQIDTKFVYVEMRE